MVSRNKSASRSNDATDYADEVYRTFMSAYVKRINESTLRVPIRGVRIGSAKYSRLAQINLKTGIITFSRFAIENVPERGRRYLVLHELAHVKEASHNKYFWSLVAEHEPDYKRIGKELEQAFHTNVREAQALQRKSTSKTLLPLIRTARSCDPDTARSDEIKSRSKAVAEGLIYPLDRGITVEDEFYCEPGDALFEYSNSGIMYGGSVDSEELADEYFDHIYL